MRFKVLLTVAGAGLGLVLLPLSERSSAAGAGEMNFRVDPVHSSMLFCIRHLEVCNFYGRFNRIDGSFRFDRENPGNSAFQFTVPTDSVDSNDGKRDKHLRSPDFFNAAQFKTIEFKSTGVKAAGDNHYEVSGDLTFHGVTKPITATFKLIGENNHPVRGYKIGFETEVTIKRSDFGVTAYLGDLGDDVRIILSIEGDRM